MRYYLLNEISLKYFTEDIKNTKKEKKERPTDSQLKSDEKSSKNKSASQDNINIDKSLKHENKSEPKINIPDSNKIDNHKEAEKTTIHQSPQIPNKNKISVNKIKDDQLDLNYLKEKIGKLNSDWIKVTSENSKK